MRCGCGHRCAGVGARQGHRRKRSVHQSRPDRRRRRDEEAGPGHGGQRVQLRRTRLPGSRDVEVSDRHPGEGRLHRRARRGGNSHRVLGHVGLRQAGDLTGFRHRRHSAGVAETRRGLSSPIDPGRAGPRRGPQLRHAAEHRRGPRSQDDHGTREAARDHQAVARSRRRTPRQQGLSRTRRSLQGRGRRPLHPRGPGDGRGRRPAAHERHGVGRVHVQR